MTQGGFAFPAGEGQEAGQFWRAQWHCQCQPLELTSVNIGSQGTRWGSCLFAACSGGGRSKQKSNCQYASILGPPPNAPWALLRLPGPGVPTLGRRAADPAQQDAFQASSGMRPTEQRSLRKGWCLLAGHSAGIPPCTRAKPQSSDKMKAHDNSVRNFHLPVLPWEWQMGSGWRMVS